MQSLFSTQSGEAGFRLQAVEIYNWGVFDGQIFRIAPEGNTSLLTGANGSGKTSFVDAILTLLVPERRMRFYNLSSGSASKNERNEESYVLGEFGDIESEEKGKETQRLRLNKEKTFSILLAVFKSEERFMTLAQIRWFVGSDLKRAYIVAQRELSIEKDLIPFDANGQWRRALRIKYPKLNNREMIELFDGPSQYAQTIRKHLGMRSEKALTLFSQTVGLKVLGNLNEFIRINMLQESPIEEEFMRLKEGFRTLLDAHTEIEKARQQLDLLEPIVTKNDELRLCVSSHNQLTEYRDTLPPYFAQHKSILLTGDIKIEKEKNELLAERLINLKTELDIKRESEREIDANIRNDEVGKQVQTIQKDIFQKDQERKNRFTRSNRYNEIAAKVGFTENPDEALFKQQIERAGERKKEIHQSLPDLNDKWSDTRNELKLMQTDYLERGQGLEALQKQKNNITGRVAEIRQEILDHVGATEDEIPFIGELLQVLSDEKKWESSIEKVLHNFALRIIIPDKYYDEVNRFVNENNLRGRLVYHRFNPKESFINEFIPNVDDSIFSKLQIKDSSDYAEWVENRLKTEYDFVCTDDMDVFRSCRRAVTSDGLTKNNSRHEKDDREKGTGRERFVLGWDNKAKTEHLRDQLIAMHEQLKEKEAYLAKLKAQQDKLISEREILSGFLQYDKFEEINWQEIAEEIATLNSQKVILEKTNDRVQELSRQQAVLREDIKKQEQLREELSSEKVRSQDRYEKAQLQMEYLLQMLDAYKHVDLEEKFNQFESEFEAGLTAMNVQNIDTVRHRVENEINRRLNEEKDRRNKEERQLQNLMRDFREPKDEIRKKFIDWTSDTHKLSSDVEYVQEYIDLFERIRKQELTEHKLRFKKYLNEDMINRMTNFTTLLERQEEDINENIEALNFSLEKINFRNNPNTFIQLYAERDNSREIRDFRHRLAGWRPNLTEYEQSKDDSILENSFENIRSLIDDLSNNEIWRKTVTDVRNWFNFKAKEHLAEDSRNVFKVYESTGKLSGGEKAQLTYTILGSALAYQFGISQGGLNPNSFRFICVDESFSNQDDEKSKYLMELCRQLHLQLLVVTPEDKMHIVEPYISAVHFVKRQNNRNSVVFDMPIKQFFQKD